MAGTIERLQLQALCARSFPSLPAVRHAKIAELAAHLNPDDAARASCSKCEGGTDSPRSSRIFADYLSETGLVTGIRSDLG